jgi:DNA topoisomerase II
MKKDNEYNHEHTETTTEPEHQSVEYAVSQTHKTIEEKYKKMTHIEHILELPDTYIGSIEPTTSRLYVYNSERGCMEEKDVTYVESLYKICDEILVNAFDQCIRLNEKLYLQKQINEGKAKPTPEVNLNTQIYPTYNIYVDINREKNIIRVRNDGEGISSSIHKEHKIHVPELIFGNLLTGSNYDKNEHRVTGGRNGYGSKLCNIYSTNFIVETIDIDNMIKYKQMFKNNMSKKSTPLLIPLQRVINKQTRPHREVIVDENGAEVYPYTEIIFSPDLKRFKLDVIDDGTYELMIKRVYDISACVPEYTNVYLNGVKLEIHCFEDYVNMFIGREMPRVVCRPHRWWDVVVTVSPDHTFNQMSFVNGCWTIRGGKHVELVSRKLSESLAKTKEAIKNDLKPRFLKENMWVFIKSHIVNPSFDTQTKTTLTTKPSEFGSLPKFTDDDINKITELGILERARELSQFKSATELKKTDGKKTSKLYGILKLDDAHFAGTAKSGSCSLILTEGDSARTFAIKACDTLDTEQREYIGVYPLRGKMLNVKNATVKQLQENNEINELKRILGLKQGANYFNDASSLRYGSIIIMTDADTDGDHIKGLIMNFFHSEWKSLLERNGFVKTVVMPIIKATRKGVKITSTNKAKNEFPFHTIESYEKWAKTHDTSKWLIQYYKGLATYNDSDTDEVFKIVIKYLWNNEKMMVNEKTIAVSTTTKRKGTSKKATENIQKIEQILAKKSASVSVSESESASTSITSQVEMFEPDDDIVDTNGSESIKLEKKGNVEVNKCDFKLNMAFRKNYIAERKEWIMGADQTLKLEQDNTLHDMTYDQFIDQRLLQFSLADIARSVPNVIDGLKPSQRKILYGFFKHSRICDNGIKVSQIGGYISEHTSYEHGETSLNNTMVGMAQRYVGANNLNVLKPLSQFGSRIQNGEDAGHPRYILINIEPITHVLFNETDTQLLNKQIFEGSEIEPQFYAPILPMILINGSKGIGTGYSTNIPMYHPFDIYNCIVKRMKGEDFEEPTPWFRGYKGSIVKHPSGLNTQKFTMYGKYEFVSAIERKSRKEGGVIIDKNEVVVNEIPLNYSFEKYKDFIEQKILKEKESGKRIIIDFQIDKHSVNRRFHITFERSELVRMLHPDDSKLVKYLGLSSNVGLTNLMMFDYNGKLKKYDNAKHIINDFYDYRIQMYQKRLDLMKRRAELDYMKTDAKIRFMTEVSEGKLILHKRKKDEVIDDLRTREYSTYSDSWYELGYSDGKGTYDYLLNIRMTSFIQESIDRQQEKFDKQEEHLNWLDKMTPMKLWLSDLKQFKTKYLEMMKDWYIDFSNSGKECDSYVRYINRRDGDDDSDSVDGEELKQMNGQTQKVVDITKKTQPTTSRKALDLTRK